MKKQRKVMAEAVIRIGSVSLNVVNGQVNPEDQDPAAQEFLKKVAELESGGGSDITVNLPPAEGAGAIGGAPPMGGEVPPMGGEPPIGGEGGMPGEPPPPPPMGGEGDIGGEAGGLPPAAEAEPHFPGEGAEEHEEHEAAETPGEEAEEHSEGESESEEKDEGGEEKEEGGEKKEKKEKKGPPPFGKKGEKAEESILKIANMITEDVRVHNGKIF